MLFLRKVVMQKIFVDNDDEDSSNEDVKEDSNDEDVE